MISHSHLKLFRRCNQYFGRFACPPEHRALLLRRISTAEPTATNNQRGTEDSSVDTELDSIRIQYQSGMDSMLSAVRRAMSLQDKKFSDKLDEISSTLEKVDKHTSILESTVIKQREELIEFQRSTEEEIRSTGKRVQEECWKVEAHAETKFKSFELKLNEHIWNYNLILLIVSTLILGYSYRLKLLDSIERVMDQILPTGWFGRTVVSSWKEELRTLMIMSERIKELENRSMILSLLSLEIARQQRLCDTCWTTSYWFQSISNGYNHKRKLEALIALQSELVRNDFKVASNDLRSVSSLLELYHPHESSNTEDSAFLNDVLFQRLSFPESS